MADNTTTKRPRYFKSQFLVLRDFEDEQAYHEDMLRLHNRGLHSWGVVKDDLQVDPGIMLGIHPGLAIDGLGREIVVEKGGELYFLKANGTDQLKMEWNEAMSLFQASQDEAQKAATATGSKTDVYITITFQEIPSDDPEDKYPPTGQQVDVTRYKQAPLIKIEANQPTDGSSITLARVSLDAAGKLSIVYNSARTLAGSVGPLSFTSGSPDNNKALADNMPQFGIAYDVMMDALTIKARSQAATPGLDATRLTINRDTGNVGIGTTSFPTANAKLVVSDTTQNAARVVLAGQEFYQAANTSGDGVALLLGTNRSGNRQLWIGDSAALAANSTNTVVRVFPSGNTTGVIDAIATDGTTTKPLSINPNGGNVGIGITTPPQALLHVGGLIIADNQQVALPMFGKLGGTGDRLLLWRGDDATYPYSLGIDSNNLWYSVPNYAQHRWYVAGLELMRLYLPKDSGGIGLLHISGAIQYQSETVANPALGESGGAGDRLILHGGSDASHPYSLGIDNNNLWYSVPTGSRHSWHVGGTEMLRIDSSGKVGIGTTSPGAKLSVIGDPATVNIETKEIVRLVRPAVTNVKNQNSAGFLVGAFEQSLVGRSRLDIALAGTPTDQNQWGGLPDTTVMSMLANGNVGIGSVQPSAKLEVQGGADSVGINDPKAIAFSYRTGGYRHWIRTRHNSTTGSGNAIDFYVNNDATTYGSSGPGAGSLHAMTLDSGRVGIGTISPSKAKLEVSGSANTQVNGYGYLNKGGAGTYGTYTGAYSIWASDRIAAVEFNAYSDERIKNIEGRSDSATDLHTLLGIEITDYVFKDVITKGSTPHKMVIGQQVERVFPQAVSKLTDVVPDIYQQASFADGWVALSTDLKKGERVRLISDKEQGVYEVLEVTPDKFRTDFKPEGDKVFVFGREVNDFRTVDYDAIAMLNVSATQQLKREKDEEVKALQAENAEMKARLDALEAAMQRLLLSGGTHAARPDSTSAGVTSI